MAIENHAHRQNEQRWRTAFENLAVGITMADFTGHFFAANSAFRNMVGYTESELSQTESWTLPTTRTARLTRLVGELVEGKRQHFEIKKHCRKDGTSLFRYTPD